MRFIYIRSQLKSRINAGIHGRIGVLIDENDFVNDVARTVLADFDLATTERKMSLSPKLFNGIYEYSGPTDLKDQAIIDVPAQVKKNNNEWYLTTPEEFYRTRETGNNIIAIDYDGDAKKLLLSSDLDDENRVISELDSLTSGGGTWSAFGDATNLAQDNDNFVVGSGSISFDINGSGGTTAGLVNTALDEYDIDDFLDGNGAAFTWVYLSDADDITNFILRLGTNSTNYYYKTVTTAADGTAFVAGWNLIRFDLTSLSSSGSPATEGLTYAALYMTKSTGKINQTDFHFDWLVLKRGSIHLVKYYSKYPWVDGTTGAWKQNSDDDSDLVAADESEYQLFILKGKQMAAEEANEFEIASKYEQQYTGKMGSYMRNNPSKRKIETTEYYRF